MSMLRGSVCKMERKIKESYKFLRREANLGGCRGKRRDKVFQQSRRIRERYKIVGGEANIGGGQGV